MRRRLVPRTGGRHLPARPTFSGRMWGIPPALGGGELRPSCLRSQAFGQSESWRAGLKATVAWRVTLGLPALWSHQGRRKANLCRAVLPLLLQRSYRRALGARGRIGRATLLLGRTLAERLVLSTIDCARHSPDPH